jgi:carbonic anhydrase
MTAREALQKLEEGNARFVAGAAKPDWFADLSEAQHPFATILGCSDSRVPPEILFDQGLGDLFIVRVAGNVVGAGVLGSLGYALEHLHTPLFVVLGHEKCGAVQAALSAKFQGHREQRTIGELVDAIVPALEGIEAGESAWDRAVEANVQYAVRQLAATPGGREAVKAGCIELVGAIYELATGRVRFLDGEQSPKRG